MAVRSYNSTSISFRHLNLDTQRDHTWSSQAGERGMPPYAHRDECNLLPKNRLAQYRRQSSITIPSRSCQPDSARVVMPSRVDETHAREHYPTVQESKSPYDEASAYVQDCRSWRTGSSRHHLRHPREDYDKPLVVKMPLEDWNKLSSDINWGESDEA